MDYKNLRKLLQVNLPILLRCVPTLSGIIEDIPQYHHGDTLEQVNSSTTDEKRQHQDLEELEELEQISKQFLEGCYLSESDVKAYQFLTSLESSEQFSAQFLENCLASDSPKAKTYQFFTELAAKEQVSIDEVKYNVYVLTIKLQDICDHAAQLGKDSRLRTSRGRRLKKAVKEKLVAIGFCNELIAEVVERFWNYLSVELQEKFRETAAALASVDAQSNIDALETRLSYHGRLPDIARRKYYFYSSILHLRASLLRVSKLYLDDTGDIEDDDYQACQLAEFFDKVMESALNYPSQYLEVYTEEMAAEDDELTKDVIIDD
jgi:hypothetical protein